MAISGQVTLKVTPEQLFTKATETKDNISKLTDTFDTISEIIENTKSYWIGEAGDLHRKLYTDENDKIQEMFARLKEHPADLEQIANNYIGVEKKVAAIAQELPGDIII